MTRKSNELSKHEKEDARDDKQVPPDKTPSTNEPEPGKRGK